ncbi:putative ATP-dependent RNA helicase DHR1, partial [Ascosphaera pollenicola]
MRWTFISAALMLLQTIAVIAHADSGNSADSLPPNTANTPEPTTNNARHNSSDENGQDAVNAALNIINDIEIENKRNEARQGLTTSTSSAIKTILRYLFLNSPTVKSDQRSSETLQHTNPKIWDAARLLKSAATQGNNDAVFLLAEMNFYGNWTYPRNYRRAFELYESLVSTTGNHTAQYMVGFIYATGIGDAVERDQGKALLYHTFAALGGNVRSQMTLAFRRHTGIGTPRDCDQAVYYYKQVADRAMEYYQSGPPGGRTLPRESYRWADEEGGVYGEGASVSTSSTAALAGPDASMEDVVEYLDLLAKKGDVKATFSLGKMYYEGSRNFPRNIPKAMKYFSLVTKHYWGKNGKVLTNHPAGIEKIAAKAGAHLGHMYLRGEEIPQDFDKALMWFNRGKEHGDPMALHFLGLMYMSLFFAAKAASYFKAAADRDHPLAETQLGIMFLDQGDIQTASHYLELAARYGGISAFYYLAEISDWGLGRERQCGVAAGYYKVVAEKAEGLHSAFAEANQAYERGDVETALVAVMMAAEQGYESAQAN